MGWIGVVFGGVAAWFFRDSGHSALKWIAIIIGIGCFWTWGMMHNFAVEAAKRRPSYKGEFATFTREETDSVPNGLAFVAFLLTVAALALLITAIVLKN